jgi:hypothetical protein
MGTTSAAKTATLSNTGGSSLNISGITVIGANPYDFAQTTTCGASVAAGANCAINVTFAPTALGSRSASLAIADNAGGSPPMVSLAGTGISMATPPGSDSIVVNGSGNGDIRTMYVTVTVQ